MNNGTPLDTNSLTKLLTPHVTYIGDLFKNHGHEVRVVGGSVRDTLTGNEAKDIDLATTATPQEIIAIIESDSIKAIKYVETGLAHGTITLIIDNEPYEITTLREDIDTDGRNATVKWTNSFKEDALRRDLTINAMSVGMDGKLHDYFGGVGDLRAGRVRFVGDTEARIQEDYLRILRYFRFLGKLDNPVRDETTLSIIADNAVGLNQISGERIWSELRKILRGKNVSYILEKMNNACVLEVIGLPYKCSNVYETVGMRDSFDRAAFTAALGSLEITALTHLIVASDCRYEDLVQRLKFSTLERTTADFIMRMSPVKSEEGWQGWKRMMIMNGARKDHLIQLALYMEDYELAQEISFFDLPEFHMTGKDLIKRGYPQGKELGEKLRSLKEDWFATQFPE